MKVLPRTFASREALAAAVAHQGFPKDLVDWLGSNLSPADPALGADSPLTWVEPRA